MVLSFLKGSYEKVRSALSKTRSLLGARLTHLLCSTDRNDLLELVEEALYEADVGVDVAQELAEKIEAKVQADPNIEGEALLAYLREEFAQLLSNEQTVALEENPTSGEPTVILFVGVNGSGKTTSCAKLAALLKEQGKSVLMGACDTFRAAATEQIATWADRTGVTLVRGHQGADSAAVAFDAVTAGKARGVDIVLIDTAGRLESKGHLMKELEKLRRSIAKVIPSAPHETLLTIDATTGQNGINQAMTFNTSTPLTGLILTKLDGTAKGGVVIPIQKKLDVPVKFLATGESLEDIQPFDAQDFANSLLEPLNA